MAITLDNQRIFGDDCPVITIESLRRSFIESSAPGLDGVISIDLGSRGRKLRQTGRLRAKSAAELNRIIAGIQGYIDGKTHCMITTNDGTFNNLRMDSFIVTERGCEGAAVIADYQVAYTQLV
jgi:hypothetical protein